MLEDAINTIVGIMNQFPKIFRFSIVEKDNIKIEFTDAIIHGNSKIFSSAIELLEWCEENLK